MSEEYDKEQDRILAMLHHLRNDFKIISNKLDTFTEMIKHLREKNDTTD